MVIFWLVRKMLFIWESMVHKNDKGTAVSLLYMQCFKWSKRIIYLILVNVSKNAHLTKNLKELD